MWMEENPIIAAVRTHEEFRCACASEVKAVFLLNANLLTLSREISEAHAAEKKIFVHLDLADGLGKDSVGLRFLKNLGSDGVISTRNSVIRAAREIGLVTVQRFFIVDSHSIATAADSIRSSLPNLVELMPGIIPKVLEKMCRMVHIPVIAGGLIESKEEIFEALRAGAAAVSTGCSVLWDL